MSIRIELQKRDTVFTCGDYITGKAILYIPTDETVSSITVKMEGISRTRLEPPPPEELGGVTLAVRRPTERRRAEVENHRLLYVVQTVFPQLGIRAVATSSPSIGYTLRAGLYEYPFKVRIPMNSACTDGGTGVAGGILNRISFENGGVDYVRSTTRHMRTILPPSLSGVPGDAAWIKYFLKATVHRPKLFKTNMRSQKPFVFLPIEPPRPPRSAAETFARRKSEFLTVATSKSPRRPFFRFRSTEPEPPAIPMKYSLEARLPNPPIIVPNDPLPLRIIYKKLSPFPEVVTLRSLQISLLITTRITAHELLKDKFETLTILSIAGLHFPIGNPQTPPGTEIEFDRSLWASLSLPDTIPPTFTTCNITRTYQLQVNIGASRGSEVHVDVLPLRLPLQVWSGIAPSQQMINRVSLMPQPHVHPQTTPHSPQTTHSPLGPKRSWHIEKKPVPGQAPTLPPRRPTNPANATTLSAPKLTIPQRRPNTDDDYEASNSAHMLAMEHSGFGPMTSSSTEGEMAPPPAYEDAIADDIAPVDGPRRRYVQGEGYYQAVQEEGEGY